MPFKKHKERKRASKRREQPCISRWNEAAGLRQTRITQSSSFATVTTQRLAALRPQETGPSGGTCCWFPRSRLAVPGNAAQNRRVETPVHRAPGLAKAPCVNTRCPQLRADEPWGSGVKPTPATRTLPMYQDLGAETEGTCCLRAEHCGTGAESRSRIITHSAFLSGNSGV